MNGQALLASLGLSVVRLEGDELVAWVRAISACEQAHRALMAYNHALLEERGLDPGIMVITNDGHIMPRSQMLAFLEAQAHARSDPQSDPGIPGNATRPPDLHSHDGAGSDPGARTGSEQPASPPTG